VQQASTLGRLSRRKTKLTKNTKFTALATGSVLSMQEHHRTVLQPTAFATKTQKHEKDTQGRATKRPARPAGDPNETLKIQTIRKSKVCIFGVSF
jgi:hypothetical protein